MAISVVFWELLVILHERVILTKGGEDLLMSSIEQTTLFGLSTFISCLDQLLF